MRRLSILAASFVLLASCESTNYPPPVTPRMATVAANQHVDLATLRQGRTLFVSRCIECHTLPVVTEHRASEWPGLVAAMAKRADLKPDEQRAVVAYILAVRAQQ